MVQSAEDAELSQEGVMHYRITVKGLLDPRWTAWFAGMQFTYRENNTTMSGPVRDQSELHGMLTRLRDLNLTLLSLHCLDVPTAPDRPEKNSSI